MHFLFFAALLPLTASFASTPYKKLEGSDFILAETTRAVPEGLVLIRDTYQFDNAKHPMTGFTPDSPGPHKLIVVLSGQETTHDSSFALRRESLEKTVAVQGHGMVVVETPDYEK